MTARLTDEQVAAWVALADPARSDHAIALACEVQEWRSRRCDGCELYSTTPNLIGGICRLPVLSGLMVTAVPARHACNEWLPKS